MPFSRSACTNFTPGICCGARSTATASKPRAAKRRAWRPGPLATSSTGPLFTSGAQRTTHSLGDSGPMLEKDLAKDRAMATRLVLAIATHGKIRSPGESGQRLQKMLLPLHFLAIAPGERLPVAVRELDQRSARR